jgi:uncharacterized protein (DUF58 family)
MSDEPINDDNLDGRSRLPNLRRLSTYDRTKDISYHPYFLGVISRWSWRLWMYRVTDAGRWFIGLSLILILFGTSSIDLQIYVPLLYAFGIWLLAWCIAMFIAPKVDMICSLPDRVAAGSIAQITITATSQSRWPLEELTILPMRLSPFIDCLPGKGVQVKELQYLESTTATLGLHCRKRGVYTLKGFRVESSFPLGLLNSYSMHWRQDRLLVYPLYRALNHIDIPHGMRYQPGGVALASQLGDSLEFIGNREYREGDNIRDIDWRATARLTRPIVREYREEYFHRAGLILDTSIPKNNIGREEDFERAISVCAAISDYMSRAEYVVDLLAAGPMLYHLAAGRNLAYQDQILDILACLEPAATGSFEVIEAELFEILSQLTSVVCIFLDWNQERHRFVERIQQITAVKVVIVRDEPCAVDPLGLDAELSLRMIDRDSFLEGVNEL